ncbi:hypothetical protein ACFVYT_29120 [Streptomyces sp. NPDC058290]|uniref:hypothetical protein n=1 Tax=Streptomyces sp. NPDC058290 TaxID=3346426 RepID=UPI0036E61038
MGEADRQRDRDVRYEPGKRRRARIAVAARAADAADLARLLDMLALWPALDTDAAVGCTGMDLAGFNDSV